MTPLTRFPLRWAGAGVAVLFAAALLSARAPILPLPKAPVVLGLPDNPPAWLKGFRCRWAVQVVGDPAKQKAQTVVVALPTGGRLDPKAPALAVQSAGGKVLPAAVLSHDPAGDTLLQFQRNDNDRWYWVYGGCDAPPAAVGFATPPKEGLTLELRDWAGDEIDSWAKVRAGL